MRPSRTMPDVTVLPQLVYEDVGAAISWLCDRFGFTERWRVDDHRAQLAVGAGAVVLHERGYRPLPGQVSLLIRVDDVDAMFARCQERGVEVVSAPQDHPYGERQFTVRDLGGHQWTFSETLADLAPEDWGGQRPSAADPG